MLLLTSITAKKKNATDLATTGFMRFLSSLNLLGKTIQNSALYLPRDFEGNNQRLQSSSTGPVGEKEKSEKRR